MPSIAFASRRAAALAPRARQLVQLRSLATAATSAETAIKSAATPVFVEEFSADEQAKLPQFTLGRAHGFLPRSDPLPGVELPKEFHVLNSLLERMTMVQPGETEKTQSGLLSNGGLGPKVHELLVDGAQGAANAAQLLQATRDAIAGKLTVPGVDQTKLLSALFRDMCFLTSAYLLEPTDQAYRATGLYAPGREVVPSAIAQPLVALANELGHFPFMEYSSSYALQNYMFKNKDLLTSGQLAAQQSAKVNNKFGHELQVRTGPGRYAFDNMKLIRSFENPYGSEAGFILVHVEMLSFSGRLLSATEDMLLATEAGEVEKAERALMSLLAAFHEVQESMSSMWGRSKSGDYLKFRSFIFGTLGKPNQKANGMFPNGVTYQGCGPNGEDVPSSNFRGESGANDSIIPMADNLLELTASMPDNDFTRVLRDFRRYRPKNQREYLSHLEARSSHLGVRAFCTEGNSSLLKALYILLADQVREFRDRHWSFTRAYIVKNSDYSIATGGSNILSYLPHNLAVVLKVLDDVYATWTPKDEQALLNHPRLIAAGAHETAAKLAQDVRVAGERAHEQRHILERDVAQIIKEKAEKNPNIEESQRGMLTSNQNFDRVAGGCGQQVRQYHSMTGLGLARRAGYQLSSHPLGNMNIRMKRGWVGSDGVG